MTEYLQLPYLHEKHQISHSAKSREETKLLREKYIQQNLDYNKVNDVDFWPTLRKHLPPHMIRKQLRTYRKQEDRYQGNEKKETSEEIWRKHFKERWKKEVVKRSAIMAYPTDDNKKKVPHMRPTFEGNFFYQTDHPKNVKSRFFVAPDWKSERTSWEMFNSNFVPAIHLCSLF